MNTWTYDIGNWYPEEGSPFIGNGWIGGNIPLNGHGGADNAYAASLAANYMGPGETFAMVPHWLNVRLVFNGQPAHPQFRHFHKVLDLRNGTFLTEYIDADGSLRVATETFCHRGEAALCAYRIRVTALRGGTLVLTALLDSAPCRDPVRAAVAVEAGRARWVLDFGDRERRVAQTLQVLAVQPAVTPVPLEGQAAISQRFPVPCAAGASFTIDVLVATTRGPDPQPEADAAAARGRAAGYDDLKRGHAAAMEALWRGFEVAAEDPYLERRLRGALFYLTCGYREEVVWGGTPSSLSSKANWGNCVFWDTEFYMFPPLLLTHPELARNMLEYRHRLLPGARANAATDGARGARFGWQSHLNGSGHAGPFENEIHLTADVAFCAWWYAQATGDTEFLETCGREMVVEAARFFASRTRWNAARARAEIHGVIPPDEHVWDHYAGLVNNSVMTNAYAAWTLAMGAALGGGLAAPGECAEWQRLASALWLPRDTTRGIYLEYEGYNGHPCKQADVGHLFFPLKLTDDADEIRRNVYYYADRERETGLYLLHSPAVYGAALSRAGDAVGVRRFLDLSARNATGPFEVPRESNYGGGVCVTASGALLTLALYGLLGLENSNDRLAAHPCLTPETGRLAIAGIRFRGRRFRVAAEPGATSALIEPLGISC